MALERIRFLGPCIPTWSSGDQIKDHEIVGYTRPGSCYTGGYGELGYNAIYQQKEVAVPLDEIENPVNCCVNVGIKEDERKQCNERGLEPGSFRCDQIMSQRCGYPYYTNDAFCDQYRTNQYDDWKKHKWGYGKVPPVHYQPYYPSYGYGNLPTPTGYYSSGGYGYGLPNWGSPPYLYPAPQRYNNPYFLPNSYDPIDYFYYKHGDKLCDFQPSLCRYWGIDT